MRAWPTAFEHLVDDAAMFPPGNAEVADAVVAHRGHRRSWYGPMVGPLVVSDSKLSAVGRAVAADQQRKGEDALLAVSVVNTSGAGGLTSLAGRALPGVHVVAVESALRDIDDLAGNARRLAAAARDLGDEVRVFVEIPYAPGWEGAVAVVEEAGLNGKLRTGGLEASDSPSAEQLASQLSVLVEADLSFKATAGLHHAWPTVATEPGRLEQHGFLNLLEAVDVLVDGASVPEAAEVLRSTDRRALADQVGGWSASQATRVRRRLLSFGCCGVLDPVTNLVALGLLSEES